MTEQFLQNNQVTIAGEIISEFTFSHQIYGEGFYVVDVKVSRLSDAFDIIPLMISERIINVSENYVGCKIEAKGQFRSFNRHENGKNHLVLSVFVRNLEFLMEEEEYNRPNQIFLDGYICKEPVYRMTPLGREIADILIAVNRAYGKSDYIPCICWGRNARFAGTLEIGSHIAIWGRIQSRDYQKRLSDGSFLKRTAYEVSVSKMESLEMAV